jgi:hypothetical protein
MRRMTSNSLKTPMAALPAKATQRPTEEVSRILSTSEGYREFRIAPIEATPMHLPLHRAVNETRAWGLGKIL